MKKYLLYIAMFLLILCVPFRGNEEGARWLWEGITWIPISLLSISLICIGYYLHEQKNHERINGEKR